ncbi:hypothetical protein BDK51DRAFT_28771 [Blyttiomyces helicus]|uniref:Uncharacterized protein n=1 Tax=Blyttiomyces helicus TaxID=388810 RepID=A0A4P9WI64_9FUNG|nr:hypothetical protein BDK51DRAFT_28771 [Blyttiomyces helicus]|eukprot:RKO90246.1 hypothetical protein BDK51DRAFT_28771 [Blyttiomyces helicus]
MPQAVDQIVPLYGSFCPPPDPEPPRLPVNPAPKSSTSASSPSSSPLIMQDFRDSRLDESGESVVGLYSNLCAASLVGREWEASATSQLWDHVVIPTAEALRVFMACCRTSPRGAELAAMVRVLDIRSDFWSHVDGELRAQVTAFAPWLRGLRALSIQPPHCYDLPHPPVSLVASFLSACPALTLLETPDLETDECESDPAAVARGVARLRCLRISHDEERGNSFFQALLVRGHQRFSSRSRWARSSPALCCLDALELENYPPLVHFHFDYNTTFVDSTEASAAFHTFHGRNLLDDGARHIIEL